MYVSEADLQSITNPNANPRANWYAIAYRLVMSILIAVAGFEMGRENGYWWGVATVLGCMCLIIAVFGGISLVTVYRPTRRELELLEQLIKFEASTKSWSIDQARRFVLHVFEHQSNWLVVRTGLDERPLSEEISEITAAFFADIHSVYRLEDAFLNRDAIRRLEPDSPWFVLRESGDGFRDLIRADDDAVYRQMTHRRMSGKDPYAYAPSIWHYLILEDGEALQRRHRRMT